MKKFSEIVRQIDEAKKTMELLPTGFKELDEFLDGGFIKKELVVLGAGTGRGKSLFGGNIFYNIAKEGHHSAYFSLEISNETLVSRLLGSKSNIKPARIMIKNLEGSDLKKKDEAEADISVHEEFMHFYDDLYELTDIESAIRENGYDFVVIDFIQNIMLKQADEYERLSQIALRLQKLAKEANTCVLLLSQLSNQMVREKQNDIVEYKGSGSIGTVCDLGFFIEKDSMPNMATLKLRKNRRGASGVTFTFSIKDPGGLITDYIM